MPSTRVARPRRWRMQPGPATPINYSHPLAQGLVFCALPGASSRQDLVTGNFASFTGTPNYTEGPLGPAYNDPTITGANCISYPFTGRLGTIATTAQVTMVTWMRIDNSNNWGAIIDFPWAAGSWSAPFDALKFSRNSSTSSLRIEWTTAGGVKSSINSDTGAFNVPDTFGLYAVTADIGGGSALFYRNGIQYGAPGSGTGSTIGFNTQQPVCLLTPSSTFTQPEAIQGIISFAAIWNRQLTAAEMEWLYVDPFAFFAPPVGLAKTGTPNLVAGWVPASGSGYAPLGMLASSVPPVPPSTPGYEYTSRSRTFLATPTITPPVAPVPPSTDLATLGIPLVSETYPQPVVIQGIPYLDTAQNPWLPTSTASGIWATQLQVVVNNQDVTFFRSMPAVVQNWGSQQPFGDNAASVLFPGITSFDHLPVPQALPIGEVVGIANTYTGNGYWQASALGLVTAYGDAAYFGDVLGLLDQSITGIAAHPSGQGYALCAADGGVFCFGDVPFEGSMFGTPLAAPVVGIALSATGNGYWLVGQDGGVFAFGDALPHGTAPVVFPSDVAVGITRSTGGAGYVIASQLGGVYCLGDAVFYGNGLPYYEAPYTGVAAHPSTGGYLLVNSLGAAYAFGSEPYEGGCSFPLDQPVNSVAVTPSGNGYWMSAGDGGVFAFGDAKFLGSIPGGGTTDFGSLSWLRLGAPITINYIDVANAPHTLFEGVVADWEDTAAAGADIGLTVQCVGALFQLDWYVAKPIFDLPFLGYNPDTGAPVFGWDIGTAIATAINSAITNPTPGTAIGAGWTPPESPGGSPLSIAMCSAVNTGILTVQQPQWDKLLTGYIQNILAQAQTLGGLQWTVSLARPRTPVIELKELDGIDWTVACGARGVAHRLSLDITTAANAIFGQGTAPTTYLSGPQTHVSVEFYQSTVLGLSGSWANSQYPQIPTTAPAFPLGAGLSFRPGAPTTGFQAFTNWMRQCGFLMQSQDTYLGNNVNAGVLDQVLIENFQQFAGLQVTGNIDVTTWNAAFVVGQNAGSITAVHYAPLAELPEVEPYTYTPSGATVGNNPAYQSRIPRIERFEQMGQQITKAQGMLSAQIELERVQVPSWTGTIDLTADPEEGSRFQILAGQNILLRFFHGQDTLFHISAVQHNFTQLTSTLTVSTQAMDLPTLASIWARDAQAHGVARQARPNLVNLNVSQNTTVFDSESGAGRVPLTTLGANQWTVVRVPFSQAGSVAEIDLTTSSPATQFAMAVFSGPVGNADLQNAGMGAPLTNNGDGNSPWNDSAAALDDLGLLYAAGGPSAGCGFWPSDPNSASPTLTGRYLDGNTWPYAPAPGYSPWLWVAFWVATGCAIQGNFRVAPQAGG